MTQRLRGNDLLAICCICWRFIQCTIDIETIVLKAPFVDDYVCREEGRLDIFRVPERTQYSSSTY
jgi:hypothetical protein